MNRAEIVKKWDTSDGRKEDERRIRKGWKY